MSSAPAHLEQIEFGTGASTKVMAIRFDTVPGESEEEYEVSMISSDSPCIDLPVHIPTNKGSQFDQRAHERITSRKPMASTKANAITANVGSGNRQYFTRPQAKKCPDRRLWLTLESCHRHSVNDYTKSDLG